MSPNLCVLAFCLTLPAVVAAAQSPLTGEWLVTIQVLDATDYQRWTITEGADGALTGTMTGTLGPGSVSGTLRSGGAFRLDLHDGSGAVTRSFVGSRSGEELAGEVPWRLKMTGRWRAVRIPAAATPRTHDFVPQTFHALLDGHASPALRVFPKDSVRTETIDADGFDRTGVRRGMNGRYTGPIYVEGAMPGDTLVIRFTRMRLNRATGFTFSSFHPGAVTAAYYASFVKDRPPLVTFTLDPERGIATPAEATGRLKNRAIPLTPMLGTVAVGPPGNLRVDGNTLGPWGGNLDYNRLVEGATMYFPVFVPGALLFFGDAHAAQGDGEISGAGIETSLDVEFTVDLVRSATISAPRIETSAELIALGIGADLDGAMQEAVSQLSQWLTAEYGFTASDTALLLGQAVQLDIAEVVGRQRVVGARIRRSLVEQP